jgi:hypothetical protein
MTRDNVRRIDLESRLNRKGFLEAMDILRANQNLLSDYESRVFRDLDDAWCMFGEKMRPTVKQFNYIRQIAFEIEKGR